jgi:nucleoside-diphosphate-sugar epimerase
MRVLLTGANGFVGSHILDELCERGIPTTILIRKTSARTFIEHRLKDVKVVFADLNYGIKDLETVCESVSDVTHIIHCAGLVRALNKEDFYRVNRDGTYNLIQLANRLSNQIQRFILISSLAAAGPSQPGKPRKVSDAPEPVSEYGKSKLEAEKQVINHCRSEYTILRPPGIYGPRDSEFLRLFSAINNHILPKIGEKQELSLVYVKDLARVAAECLTARAAARKTYFVASPEIVTSAELARRIASELKTWTIPLWLPVQALYPVCLAQQIVSKITKTPNVLSLDKYKELKAPAWTCDVSCLKNDLNLVCGTNLSAGVSETIRWYKNQGWLK